MAGYSALGAAFFVWTANALAPPETVERVLAASPLVYAGRLCYGLYLWHVLCGNAVAILEKKLHAHWSFELRVFLWVMLLVGVATVSHRLFESPILALKTRVRSAF